MFSFRRQRKNWPQVHGGLVGGNLAVLLQLITPTAFCEFLAQELFQPDWRFYVEDLTLCCSNGAKYLHRKKLREAPFFFPAFFKLFIHGATHFSVKCAALHLRTTNPEHVAPTPASITILRAPLQQHQTTAAAALSAKAATCNLAQGTDEALNWN